MKIGLPLIPAQVPGTLSASQLGSIYSCIKTIPCQWQISTLEAFMMVISWNVTKSACWHYKISSVLQLPLTSVSKEEAIMPSLPSNSLQAGFCVCQPFLHEWMTAAGVRHGQGHASNGALSCYQCLCQSHVECLLNLPAGLSRAGCYCAYLQQPQGNVTLLIALYLSAGSICLADCIKCATWQPAQQRVSLQNRGALTI